MSVPGPPGALWAFSLLLWAGEAAIVGEAIRGATVRWVRLWSSPEPVERFLVDFYLGGAAMYLVAAVQLGAFDRPLVVVLPIVAAAVVVGRLARRGSRRAAADRAVELLRGLADRWALLAVGSAVGLFVVELAVALPVGTGNTLDSSLLTTYVALLLQHGSVPLSFHPYGASGLFYPQGATVWLGWAQLTFGLPPARTALLVTPLFLALPPLAGYVLGRRAFGSPRVGAAFALALAWLGPSTRGLVGGSNDFVFSVPLVLLLVAYAPMWTGPTAPAWPDVAAFGALLGYAGALNVVGVEWGLPALLLLGALAAPRFAGRAGPWLLRWGSVAGLCGLAGAPSLYVLAEARRSPSVLAGAIAPPAGSPVGITVAQLIGDIDPFLFHGSDVELSPIPWVRLLLAGLLVLGVLSLLFLAYGARPDPRWARFARGALAAGVPMVGWLLLLFLAGRPGSGLRDLPAIASASETSFWLFLVYGLVAAVPLALALERFPTGDRLPATPPPRRPRSAPRSSVRAIAPIAFALVVVVPAVVLTPTSLASVLRTTYQDFGNASAADFALLAYGAAHFAPGARVLVAPGSAGEFLPGYARGVVMLYPMAPGWYTANASYTLVVRELTNGTLDAPGRRALASLDADVIVVTGNNTVLWPAFWSAPLAAAEVGGVPTFPVLFHEGDAWVFNATACRPGSPGCS